MTQIALLLFPGLTQLDLTGPAQFLSRMPGAKVDLVWKDRQPVMTDAGFAIVDEVRSADVLCVPGGLGVSEVIEDDTAMAWVRTVGEQAAWVTSVCTGSLILGAAGLLEGYRATTHWAWHHHLALFGARPEKDRTVTDRNRVTGGGVTAGIDFALTLITAVCSEQVARTLQLAFEYDPQPPFEGGTPEKAGADILAAHDSIASAIMPQCEAALVQAAARLGYQVGD
jgi:cyclohexyl-isocyanide hydratase